MKKRILIAASILILCNTARAELLLASNTTDYSHTKLVFEAQNAAQNQVSVSEGQPETVQITPPATASDTGGKTGSAAAIPLAGNGGRRHLQGRAIPVAKPLTRAQKVQNEINREMMAMNKKIGLYNQFRSAGNIVAARKLLPAITDYQASIKAMRQEKANY